jgi:hypothetical protein
MKDFGEGSARGSSGPEEEKGKKISSKLLLLYRMRVILNCYSLSCPLSTPYTGLPMDEEGPQGHDETQVLSSGRHRYQENHIKRVKFWMD